MRCLNILAPAFSLTLVLRQMAAAASARWGPIIRELQLSVE